jgi:flagellar protein FliL
MADQATTDEEQEIPQEKKKSKSMMIIIIVVVVLVIIIGVVMAILLMSGSKNDHSQQPNAAQKQLETPMAKKINAEFGTTVSLKEIGLLYPLDTFTVNLMSNNGQRYLKTQMSLELSNKNLAVELDAKKAVIRDRIIRLLSSKTFEEISTIKGKNKLSQQIMDVLNTMLSDGVVQGVFFTQFVVQ